MERAHRFVAKATLNRTNSDHWAGLKVVKSQVNNFYSFIFHVQIVADDIAVFFLFLLVFCRFSFTLCRGIYERTTSTMICNIPTSCCASVAGVTFPPRADRSARCMHLKGESRNAVPARVREAAVLSNRFSCCCLQFSDGHNLYGGDRLTRWTSFAASWNSLHIIAQMCVTYN